MHRIGNEPSEERMDPTTMTTAQRRHLYGPYRRRCPNWMVVLAVAPALGLFVYYWILEAMR